MELSFTTGSSPVFQYVIPTPLPPRPTHQIHHLAHNNSPKFIPLASFSGTDVHLSPFYLPGPVPGAQASQRSKLPSVWETQPGRGGRQHGGGWHQSWNVCTAVPSTCGAGRRGGRSPGEALRLSVGLICKHNATILPEETCSVESQTWRKFFFLTLWDNSS